MNLKIHLFSRILLIAVISLISSAIYVLYQTDKQAKTEANFTATSIETQVKTQMLQMFARNDFASTFPNTDLWPDINNLSGSCIQFLSRSDKRSRNLCQQITEAERTWPVWFGSLYQQLFSPNFEVKKVFSFNAMTYGSIVVTLNTRIETGRAWNNLRAVIGVLFVSIFAVSILVYITINRMLKPAQIIVTGLEKMRDGHLNTRLPSFDINEWKRTSETINQLASNQEQVIADNKQLALKLLNIQEEDHRYIARELHDEFGQCLAGINAVTASIKQTAKAQSPELVAEINTISPITSHMMDVLRSMLTRLRPAEVDDLGLTISLQKLVSSWNKRSDGMTRYQLMLNGNIDTLPDPLPVNIYRIVQECLTNIAKHAQASQADVIISTLADHSIQLEISDDGIAEVDEFDNTLGVGLLGIRERIMALGGKITLLARATGGLTVNITIPIASEQGQHHE
ncbi:MAG: two-component system sensor histidine kinase UhpB [Methylophagaceae bacterium]|jgi:two-component system sensor histidine kinase UhpB